MVRSMNWKHYLSVSLSAFVGGAGAWAATHMSSGVPSTSQQWVAFGAGMAVAGLIAVAHLIQTSPGDATVMRALTAKPMTPQGGGDA